MEIKITKKQVLKETIDGEWSYASKYYLVYGKIFNEEKTRYRPFKFCQLIYKEDLFEFDEYPDFLSVKRQNEITDALLWCFIESNLPKDYDNCDSFFKACNETIEKYNSSVRG